MAKKKKAHRRKKVSGIGAMLNPKSPLVKLAAIAGGYLLADTINSTVDKAIPASLTTATPATATAAAKPATLSADTADKILMGAELGLGALLLLKGKPSLVKSLAGGVLAGAGLKRALVNFGVMPKSIGGYQSVPVIGGYQRVPVIGNVPAQLQGTLSKVPAQLQGYRVNGPGGYQPNGSGAVMGSLYTNASANDGGSGSGIQNSNSGSQYMN